jgi:hypothetical protein
MTITETTTISTAFQLVTFDLYKDIHKGIRSELFALTGSAGGTDPGDRAARAALADHVGDVYELLELHAEHEDAAIAPHLERELPALAEQVAADHVDFEGRFADIVDLAVTTADAGDADQRRLAHLLYLELGSFTSAYLAHQDVEERQIMPALEAAIGVEAVVGVHQQIIGSIPPDVMARSLALMLPAMNVDDRTELLGGMRAGAPAEVFDGVWSLTGSVLAPADQAAVAARLGIA